MSGFASTASCQHDTQTMNNFSLSPPLAGFGARPEGGCSGRRSLPVSVRGLFHRARDEQLRPRVRDLCGQHLLQHLASRNCLSFDPVVTRVTVLAVDRPDVVYCCRIESTGFLTKKGD